MSNEPTLRKVSKENIKSIPPAKAPGFETYPVSTKGFNEMDGIGAGLMYISPGADDRTWEDFPIYDCLFCVEGELIVEEIGEDGDSVVEARADPGEFILLNPGPVDYCFKSSGVPTTVLFVNVRPNEGGAWDIAGSYGEEYAEALQLVDTEI